MLLLDDSRRSNCVSPSRQSALDATPAERAPQVGEQRVEAAIDVEWRGHLEHRRDRLRREVVDETKLEQQHVARRETSERAQQRVVQLGASDGRVERSMVRNAGHEPSVGGRDR